MVLGRNQNAWAECRVDAFLAEGGTLARRLSGGGAVYHDLGNLNFSLITRGEEEDFPRQTRVILEAVRALGVPAERTGRNDLEADGRKFSGSAYFRGHGASCHHGTLMMDVDPGRMARALNVPEAKLRSRGVPSVRARVVNLKEFVPGLDRAQLTEALLRAAEAEYGLRAEPLPPSRIDAREAAEHRAFFSSEEWLLGRRIPFSAGLEARFPWGGVRLELDVRGGRVAEAVCWSDAMEEAMIRAVSEKLRGCPWEKEALAERIRAAGEAPAGVPDATAGASDAAALQQRMAEDMIRMLREQI